MKIIASYKIHSTIERIKSLNESLDPELEKRLRLDLKKYCTSAGKDYIEICKLAGLSTEGLENLSQETVEIIEQYSSGPWSYDDKTGRVNIDGSFRLEGWAARRESSENYKKLSGVKFGDVAGDFKISDFPELNDSLLDIMCPLSVSGNYTISGSLIEKSTVPPRVGKNIDLRNNKIKKLENLPNNTDYSVFLDDNHLESLEGSPEKVGGDFTFDRQNFENGFLSLKGSPREIGGSFTGTYNRIKTMDGCPEVIGGNLDLSNNNLKDLIGNLKAVNRRIRLERNDLATLEGLPLGVRTHDIECGKNLIPPAVLKSVYNDASSMKSWLAAYLKLSATERFKRMGKAERDPIRDRITPEIIAKSPVSIAPIWKDHDLMNDPVVKRLITKSGINNSEVFKAAASTSADLLDLGF